mmetsp:Transcript_967/g.3212  ORF Transcript_967/g.3212 Transcript_967/m.3212 type:complete len:322 (-) Transcript_967:24-989(-)
MTRPLRPSGSCNGRRRRSLAWRCRRGSGRPMRSVPSERPDWSATAVRRRPRPTPRISGSARTRSSTCTRRGRAACACRGPALGRAFTAASASSRASGPSTGNWPGFATTTRTIRTRPSFCTTATAASATGSGSTGSTSQGRAAATPSPRTWRPGSWCAAARARSWSSSTAPSSCSTWRRTAEALMHWPPSRAAAWWCVSIALVSSSAHCALAVASRWRRSRLPAAWSHRRCVEGHGHGPGRRGRRWDGRAGGWCTAPWRCAGSRRRTPPLWAPGSAAAPSGLLRSAGAGSASARRMRCPGQSPAGFWLMGLRWDWAPCWSR